PRESHGTLRREWCRPDGSRHPSAPVQLFLAKRKSQVSPEMTGGVRGLLAFAASPANNSIRSPILSFERDEMATISTAVPCEDDLIQAVLAGDADSFAVLVDRHIVSIRKCVLYMVRNISDAEDIVQDVLFKIWSRLSTFRSESTFRTWATRVAINEAM